MKHLELLAPAGSIEALEAAVESGADAVYIGGTKFNARAFANNLDQDMLRKAVEYAHVRNVRVYVTVNILILQTELYEVLEYIKYLYSIDIDAVIVQDIGLAMLIRKLMPDFEVHCSTQMAIHNSDGAKLLSGLGIKRVVLARELTLQEVDKIVENTGVDAEIFVHGALCVCYSGQCYMSSLIGGRSGNRGTCAQPCRRKYSLQAAAGQKGIKSQKGDYLISTRDLNTYERLYEIASSAAASLKIEGRMKRPEYVAIIVNHYRQALDCILRGESDCLSEQASYELKIAFNREFTQGYLFNKRNQEIVSTERPDNRGLYIGKVLGQKGNMAELLIEENFLNDGDSIEIIGDNGKSSGCTISGIKKGNDTVKSANAGDRIRIYITDRVKAGSLVSKSVDSRLFRKAMEEYAYKNKRKVYLQGSFTARQNHAAVFELRDDKGNHVRIESEELVQKAQKQAVTEEKILEQLQKTKDTPYVFEQLDINIDADSFLSVKAINSLRRDAIDRLSEARIKLYRPSIEKKYSGNSYISSEKAAITPKQVVDIVAGVGDLKAGIKAIEAGADDIYIIGSYRYNEDTRLIQELSKHCVSRNKGIFYVLPQITRDNEVNKLEKMLQLCLEQYNELGMVISNISHIKLAERLKISNIRTNFSMNITNSAAVDFLTQQGLQSIGLSPELNLSQIKELSKTIAVNVESIVYGYLPAMITEYCPATASGGCESCASGCSKSYDITDERNKAFKVLAMGNCRNIILNSDVLCVYDNLANIIDSGVNKLRLDFYLENEHEIYEIVKAYKHKVCNLQDNKTEEIIKQIKEKGYTKGHYFRGIE